jgi:CHASE3 domain sensor protein
MKFKSREDEVRHLQEVEQQIARGEQRISAIRALVSEGKARGDDVRQTRETLAFLLEVQDTFTHHRARIQQSISDIDAGKYDVPH